MSTAGSISQLGGGGIASTTLFFAHIQYVHNNNYCSVDAASRIARVPNSLWSWNKNQNVALEQMKAATMVLNMLDYAIYIAKGYLCNSNSWNKDQNVAHNQREKYCSVPLDFSQNSIPVISKIAALLYYRFMPSQLACPCDHNGVKVHSKHSCFREI